jgi:hypothetical protein
MRLTAGLFWLGYFALLGGALALASGWAPW